MPKNEPSPENETSTDEVAGVAAELKAAILRSLNDFIPREMHREVGLKASHLRATFGDAVAFGQLNVDKNSAPGSIVFVPVITLYELCK